jgi:uncharacterized PurR-regulated membrane protein YhhQ (DUF165 family)
MKKPVPGDLIQAGITTQVVPFDGRYIGRGDVRPVILERGPIGKRVDRRCRIALAVVIAVAYIGSIFLANYLTQNHGLIAAGFGLLVPAGTYSAGLALGLRDALQDQAGVRWVLAAIAFGTVASWLVSPALAVASATAFLVSELVDLGVYTPLRNRGRHLTAVALSNTVGAAVDTVIFLALAGFGLTWASIGGQLLVKAVFVTAPFLAWKAVRRAVPRQPQLTRGA